MGGYSCQVPHLAIMRPFVNGIPSNAAELPQFDKQLVECFKQTDIVKGLVDKGLGDAVCGLLGKNPPLSTADRATLYGFLESLYDD